MKQWRLLNEGETIEVVDEVWNYIFMEWEALNGLWLGEKYLCSGTLDKQKQPIRRSIESGWIKLSERKPTEADGDENSNVLWRRGDGFLNTSSWYTYNPHDWPYWLPLPKFAPGKADEEAFEQWVKPTDIEMNAKSDTFYKRCAKRGWDAALEYARKK